MEKNNHIIGLERNGVAQLPAPEIGMSVTVVNNTDETLYVYPAQQSSMQIVNFTDGGNENHD